MKALNLLFISTLCVFTMAAIPIRETIPEVAIAPRSWQLKFRFEDPQRVSVHVPGKRLPVVYWYMLYSVENPTDEEVYFYPEFDLVTDTLEVVKSGQGVSPAAFKAIFDRAGDPLLLPPEKVVGRLLQGRDHQRHGVAIWKDFDRKAKSFTVYVEGLSGEMVRWKNPVFDPEKPVDDGNQRYYLLRKTLAIPYRLPGSEVSRARAVPERLPEKQTWLMR